VEEGLGHLSRKKIIFSGAERRGVWKRGLGHFFRKKIIFTQKL